MDRVHIEDDLISIKVDNYPVTVRSERYGQVSFYKFPGEFIKNNDYLYRILL